MNTYHRGFEYLYAGLGKTVLGLLCIPAIIGSALYRGYVLSCLYMWFIYSRFEGLPVLGAYQMIGISLFVTMVWYNESAIKNSKDKSESGLAKVWYAIMKGYVLSLVAHCMGYGWHWFAG